MTKELRLARGKENHDRGIFPDNQETVDYVKTLPKEKPEKPKVIPKEDKDGSNE